jgi:ParB family transcriptional regulator, chromosome partitioning protein
MSNRRDRLGRGLGALLGEYLTEGTGPTPTPTRNIPIAAIAPNPFQPRREFTEDDLADLAASIRENGLLQPIVVRPKPGEGVAQWELVAGERRWRACTRLGWTEIPASVRDVDDRTLLVLAMVENLQRSGLSPLEEADGYRRLSDEFSLTQAQVAEVVGKDRSTVANSLRLLTLPASIRRLVEDGSLTAGHARALLGMTDPRRMAELGRLAAEEGWSVREIEGRVQKQRPPGKRKQARSTEDRDPAERLLEEELQRILGTPVKLKTGRGQSGRIEIPFYGAEDFERVFELVTGKTAADVVS